MFSTSGSGFPLGSLQATQQIKLPRWVQAILRLPGGVIILALIMLPLTLVRAVCCCCCCCANMTITCAGRLPGGVVILALLMLPLTLVGGAACFFACFG